MPYAPVAEALRGLVRRADPEELDVVLGQGRAELARLVPDLGPVAGAGGSASGALSYGSAQGRLFELLLGVLERLAARAPVVFIVEDLHWSDRSTRDLLGFLVRNLRDVPVMLLFTYRSDELHRRHPLLPFLAELERTGRVERLELVPFDRRESAAAAPRDRRPRPRRDAHRVDPRPLRRQRVLRRGAARRGRRGRSVGAARHAARRAPGPDGRPRRADPGVPARRLGGRPARRPGPARGCRRARRDDALRSAPRERRSPGPRPGPDGRHRALCLPARAAPGGDLRRPAARRAHPAALRLRADARGELARRPVACRRARLPLARGPRPAARVRGVGRGGRRRRGPLCLPRGAGAVRAGDRPVGPRSRRRGAGRPRPDRAARRRPPASPASTSRRVPCRRSRRPSGSSTRPRIRSGPACSTNGSAGTPGSPVRASSPGRRIAPPRDSRRPTPPSEARARAVAGFAQVLMLDGRFSEAVTLAEEALTIARAVGARDIEGHALDTRGLSRSIGGEVDEGLDDLRAALAIAQELDIVDDIGRAYANMVWVLDAAGRLEEAIALADVAIATAERLGLMRFFGTHMLAGQADALFRLGRWDESERAVRRAEERRSARASTRSSTEELIGRLALARGRLEEAADHLLPLAPLAARAEDIQFIEPVNSTLASLALAEGRPEDAAHDRGGRDPSDRPHARGQDRRALRARPAGERRRRRDRPGAARCRPRTGRRRGRRRAPRGDPPPPRRGHRDAIRVRDAVRGLAPAVRGGGDAAPSPGRPRRLGRLGRRLAGARAAAHGRLRALPGGGGAPRRARRSGTRGDGATIRARDGRSPRRGAARARRSWPSPRGRGCRSTPTSRPTTRSRTHPTKPRGSA